MKRIITYLKGCLLGFTGLAIPGLSASTVALEVDIYYPMIDAISNIFKKFRSSILFLLFLILGYFTGGFVGSFIIDKVYSLYPLVIIIGIIGFVLGGIPKMTGDLKEGKNKPSCWISLFTIIVLLFVFSFFVIAKDEISFNNMEIKDYIILFFVGLITSSTLVIPGVDFAVLLLALGYYNPLINLIAHIFDFSNLLHNIIILGTYLIGYSIGSFFLSKIIKKLFDKYSNQCKYASFAFVIVAPFIIIKKGIIDNMSFCFNYIQLIIGLILGILGFIFMYKITHSFKKKEVTING